ncbi:MAG: NAD(P)-dependent oxidoreductase [Candidatus Avilachnospira sp.]|jgi:3-hydroxyisobutyrate dehydrogenase-like beta-hydroxyacid dehydrogenase
MKTAFFGLGNMGLPIALNLLKNGHEVSSFVHKKGEGPKALSEAGGIIAYSACEAVKGADVIFTIVPDDKALSELMLEENMHEAVKEGAVIVEMTSCSPETVIKLADAYRDKKVEVLDAPVSGGVKAARNAAMTFMCSGDKELFERMKPLLSQLGTKLFYVGKLGDGKRIKSLNNLLAAINAIGICEAANTVKKQGIDPKIFEAVVMESSGGSTQLKNNFMRIIEENFTPNFSMELMRKDVGLASKLEEGIYTPLSDRALDILKEGAVFDGENYTAVAKLGNKNSL